MTRILQAVVLVLAVAQAGPALAACPDMGRIARFASALLDRAAPEPFGPLGLPHARCAQDRLVATLAQPWGDVAGHAVVATADGVLRGALFHATLRAPSGATIEARYGARPAAAAALLLRLARDGVEHAGTDRAAIAGFVDQAAPFLALLDHAGIPEGADGPARIAANLGIRLGVRGAPVPLAAADARHLHDTPAILQDGGSVIAATAGIVPAGGHPIDLLAILARDLAAEGRPLRAGDLVAVIGPAAAIAPRAGGSWRLSIRGIGTVAVEFR